MMIPLAEDEVIRDSTRGQPEPEPETSCSRCHETAIYRINTSQPGKRRKKIEIYLCNFHFTRWELESHLNAYSIRQLKPD